MSFLEHLTELRSRLMKSLLIVVVASIVCLVFAKDIYRFLQLPLLTILPDNSSFIATTPFESYKTYFKAAFVAGFFISAPFLFWQLWGFIAPGLKGDEKKHLFPFFFLSGLLFTTGAVFGYFVVFPAGFYYVNLILQGTDILLMPKMSDYLSLALTLLLAFGVCFELPLFIFLLGKLGLIDYSHIKNYRRYVIVVLFIVAALLTPGPDVISQCLLAIPLWILFELGGVSLFLLGKKS